MPVSPETLQRAFDSTRAPLQVDISPAQAKSFSLAGTGGKGQYPEVSSGMLLSDFQEGGNLGWRKDDGLMHLSEGDRASELRNIAGTRPSRVAS
jgi:hypothetical protein